MDGLTDKIAEVRVLENPNHGTAAGAIPAAVSILKPDQTAVETATKEHPMPEEWYPAEARSRHRRLRGR